VADPEHGHPKEECNMKAQVELPQAFSVRDEHEFYPIEHLLARLNPELRVVRVATGRHVNGGHTVFWGLVQIHGRPPTRKAVEAALNEAGFDFGHNILTQTSSLWTG
jgi:hypothetical protein